ncbi:hypothetical protein ACH41H_16585 [Streptomyces sp. NPDC020800]|uniref:hypothetical protein n=1 Tax=Streptomyces sp. NPDC020800 TaxID=3365092 RepID=UPI0037AE28C8
MTIVLFAEALVVAALNWFLGMVVDRQKMSLAGLDPDVMSTSSKIGGVVFGLYFVLCAVVAMLVAIRNRAPAGFGRILLVSVAVVHGLLGAFTLGLVGWPAFLFMMVVLGLVVLLLVTYDRDGGPEQVPPGGAPEAGGDPKNETAPGVSPELSRGVAAEPHGRTGEPQDGDDTPQDTVPAQLTQPVPTTL